MLTTLSLLAVLATADPVQPGDHVRRIEVERRERSYLLHIPRGHDQRQAVPLVLVLHGATSDAAQMARFCGLSTKADAAGFVAVYPEGVGKTFNAGHCCGQAARQQVDDVAFVRAILDDVATVVKVDPKRVYATGMSNGGMMCYRLASEMSERIAAIAPVAGPMGTEKCGPKRPVSVLHFHGTADEHAPFKGGKATKGLSKIFSPEFYSVEHSIRAWVEANGCRQEAETEKLPAKGEKEDATAVARKTYSGGKEGTEVVLVVIEGGGHTWPGQKAPMLINLGKATTHVSANDLMWEFFQKHPMK